MQNLLGGDAAMAEVPQARDHGRRRARDPHAPEPRRRPGNFYIDDEVLAEAGVTDLSGYGYTDDQSELQPDIFLDA